MALADPHGARRADQLLTEPAKKSIQSLLDKVRDIIKGNATAAQDAVIRQLNPVIRGWAMCHRHAAAKATFAVIDTHIWPNRRSS